jgi:hypothetical protein
MINFEKAMSLKPIDVIWKGRLVRMWSQSVEKVESELLIKTGLSKLPEGMIIFESSQMFKTL